ncbi:MAG TPA: 2-oxoglutarate and iron-dependent oxygenase domain-containing protein [Candidatus Binataceae bacterium]|nr:2-oxoglutarate and iron-dependent oxygenase domain-containing protein [Candidatus Binataceae bacterium]
MTSSTENLPIIDIASLRRGSRDVARIGQALDRACCEFGFFYVRGHGISPKLPAKLMTLARKFFALPLEQKLGIAMAQGGRAWRGYFPIDGELTSGRPDRKEGIYFGTELGPDDPRVRAGVPLHGMNLYPALSGFRDVLMAYMNEVTAVGQLLLGGIAVGLGLGSDYFLDRYTRDPTVLFRIFNYPPAAPEVDEFGVGEHTDYGLLTLLWQDEIGGLEIWHRDRWLAAPPMPNSFVCNVGDMLERLTAGRYVSALHRVRNLSTQNRVSMPLFLDPSFDAVLAPIAVVAPHPSSTGPHQRAHRWDGADLATVSGSYGDYLLNKVSKVFPQLRAKVL